jgi:pimeloyl-ACP methyl ester carboxylesterase
VAEFDSAAFARRFTHRPARAHQQDVAFLVQCITPVAHDLRVEIIANSGHFVPEEASDAVGRRLCEFLETRVAPGART